MGECGEGIERMHHGSFAARCARGRARVTISFKQPRRRVGRQLLPPWLPPPPSPPGRFPRGSGFPPGRTRLAIGVGAGRPALCGAPRRRPRPL